MPGGYFFGTEPGGAKGSGKRSINKLDYIERVKVCDECLLKLKVVSESLALTASRSSNLLAAALAFAGPAGESSDIFSS